mgnify:CR=1 FL=1|jgi:EmrB/QacA subfamily drug resistance transporter
MRPSLFSYPRSKSLLPSGGGLFVVCLGTLVVPFDSAVNVAFPAIVHSLGLSIPAIQWVVIAYTLTYAALMLVFGRIGDMLGYRRIFLFGSGWSCLAFLACAAAPSLPALLGARALQGVGAAMALSCGPALATSLYPESERTHVLGVYTMVFGVGGVLGSILAGVLVSLWGWQAVFWFRAPVSFAAFALAWALPADQRRASGLSFDIPGAILLISAVTVLLLGLNQLQHLHAPRVLAALVLSTACLTGFILWERRVEQPLIDISFFRHWDFALVNVGHVLLNLAGFAVMLLVPFYLDRFSGLTVPATGAVLTASNLGLMLASPVAGRLAGFAPPRRLALAGSIIMAAGQAAVCATASHPVLAMLTAGMFVQGAGLGLFQVAYSDIVTETLPIKDRGVAGSLVMMTRTVGVVTGATTLMLMFQTVQASSLAGGNTAPQAFITGFQAAFALATVLSVVVVLLAVVSGWGRRPIGKP